VLELPESETTAAEELDELEEKLVLKATADIFREATSYYGYKIFQGDPGAFQTSTFGAVDPNYNIGPGDQIIVMLWGESQFRQEFTIDREGYVFVHRLFLTQALQELLILLVPVQLEVLYLFELRIHLRRQL
jgi:hypothetical protein